MFLLICVDNGSVAIMDTRDNYSIDLVPIDIFAQSKVFGIPCETRYENILSDFISKCEGYTVLRAGMLKLGVDNVLSSLCEAYGCEFYKDYLVGSEMPLGSLVSVASGNDRIRTIISKEDSVSSSDFEKFSCILDELQYEDNFDDYDDDDSSYELFSGDEETAEDEYDDYLSDDEFEFDYDDDGSYDDEDNSSDMYSVAKLYGMLSDAQVDLLKKYYKWYSKRVFRDENGSLNLDTIVSKQYNEWKKRELSNIRGEEEWVYEGCIDTGEFPGAYCEMGHALRYVHYARGVESGRVVSFGSKCVGDFFEVDATTMSAIRKAQKDSTNDLVELCSIYSDSSLFDTAINSFKVLNFVLDKFKSTGKSNLPAIVKFALEFRNLELVYPKTLVKEFKKYFIGLDTLKDFSLKSDKRSGIIKLCFGDDGLRVDNYISELSYDYKSWAQSSLVYEPRNFGQFSACFFEWLFGIELDGIHKYNPLLGLNVKDEGGKSKKAKTIYSNRITGAESSIFYMEDDLIGGAERGISSFCAIKDAESVFNSFSSNWKLPYLNAYDEKYKNLNAIKECKEIVERMLGYLRMSYRRGKSLSKSLRDCWFNDYDKFLSVSYCLATFKSGFSEICKTVVLDEKSEISDSYTDLLNLSFLSMSIGSSIEKLQYYIDRVSESPLCSYMESKCRFGLEVFETVRRTNRASSKQANVMLRLGRDLADIMTMLDNGDYSEPKIDDGIPKETLECIEKAIKILESGDKFNIVIKVIPTSAVARIKDILCNVVKYNRASDKQMYYVNLAKDLVTEVEKQENN